MHKDYLTYVATGDGELGEGSNWEGFMTINHYQLSNCIVFIDRNHCMIDGPTEEVMKLEPLADKMIAFGFNTICVDGNNIGELCDAIDVAIARSRKNVLPPVSLWTLRRAQESSLSQATIIVTTWQSTTTPLLSTARSSKRITSREWQELKRRVNNYGRRICI